MTTPTVRFPGGRAALAADASSDPYPASFRSPVRLRLTPRDTSFFDLLAASAQHLVTGSTLLAELLGRTAPRASSSRSS